MNWQRRYSAAKGLNDSELISESVISESGSLLMSEEWLAILTAHCRNVGLFYNIAASLLNLCRAALNCNLLIFQLNKKPISGCVLVNCVFLVLSHSYRVVTLQIRVIRLSDINEAKTRSAASYFLRWYAVVIVLFCNLEEFEDNDNVIDSDSFISLSCRFILIWDKDKMKYI